MPIKYTNCELEGCRVETQIKKHHVVKIFDLHEEEPDVAGMLPIDYFENEKNGYEYLSGKTYITGTGKIYNLVPKCYEIGTNYIVLEKYEHALNTIINNKNTNISLIIKNFIEPIAKRLDELQFIHEDFFPRNIVFRDDLSKVAVIDFGLSHTTKNKQCSRNLFCLQHYFFG